MLCEVGRGSLIGPVYAAAVILKNSIDKKKLKDSKKLSKAKRENLEKYIKKNSYWAIGFCKVNEVRVIPVQGIPEIALAPDISGV